MKSLTDVNRNRAAYHRSPNRNTVHRSSLIAPRLPQAQTHISFVNHFLIKRDYAEVTLRVTAIDGAGNVAESLSLPITERRVYSFHLEALMEQAPEAREYLIEFFSTKNLFIPFPAVMVNHIGADFINVVHSYNRVLNDIFEDDAVNGLQVQESSIDYALDERYDTFFNFASGPFRPQGALEVSVGESGRRVEGEAAIDMPRLSNRNFLLSDLLDDGASIEATGILRIRQPRQSMFYGRLLAGIIDRKTQAFSANHSYYDSSETQEYFDHAVSHKVYPYFPGELNRITMYPVMSPSTLAVHIELMHEGKIVASDPQDLVSPSDRHLSIDVDAIVAASGIAGCTAFRVVATARDGKTPSRVTHQLIYGAGDSKSKLLSTIAIGLSHAQTLPQSDKRAITWGQLTVAPDYRAYAGICFYTPWGEPEEISVDLYDENGLLRSMTETVAPGTSLIIRASDFTDVEAAGKFVWYNATSRRADLTSAAFHVHAGSHNASGEHGF
jgi:hypothetical protein